MDNLERTENTELANLDRSHLAAELHNKAVQGVFISAMCIKKIFDEELFRELGFETREEYAENMLPYGFRTAKMYYLIANKAGDLLDNSLSSNELKLLTSETTLEKGKPVSLEDELNSPYGAGEETAEYSERLMSLGMRKLYTLCNKLQTSQLDFLAHEGYFLHEEAEYSIGEIEEMTASQLEKIFRTGKNKEDESKPAPFSFAKWVKDDQDGTRIAYWHLKKMLFVLNEKNTMENDPEILAAVDRLGRVIEKHLHAMNEFPDQL